MVALPPNLRAWPDVSRPALLFDLDGTLIDSDPIHVQVFVDLFAERGMEIDQAFYLKNIHGRHNVEIFRDLLPEEDPHAMDILKEATFRDRLPADMPPAPGVVGLLDRAERAGWGVAVVTNAARLNAEAMLASLGLRERFETVIVGEECPAGKPDPAPYLAGLAAVHGDVRKSIAFEDSPSGIASAAGAGLTTVGLRSSLTDTELRASGASLSIKDFTDTALEPLLDRLEGASA